MMLFGVMVSENNKMINLISKPSDWVDYVRFEKILNLMLL